MLYSYNDLDHKARHILFEIIFFLYLFCVDTFYSLPIQNVQYALCAGNWETNENNQMMRESSHTEPKKKQKSKCKCYPCSIVSTLLITKISTNSDALHPTFFHFVVKIGNPRKNSFVKEKK